MKSTLKPLALLVSLILGIAGVTLWAKSEQLPEHPLSQPALLATTAAERLASIDAMKDAWARRDRDRCEENQIDERRFIFRLHAFTRRIRKTESFEPAARLLARAYYDHKADYTDLNRR